MEARICLNCGYDTMKRTRPEVKRIAHHVTEVPGGQGAVREVVELLLKAQGRWDEILRHYEVGLENDK